MIQCPKCRAYLLSSYCAVCKKEVSEMYEGESSTPDILSEIFGEEFIKTVKGKEKK